MESSVITQVHKEDVQVSPKTGQVSRSALKQPRSCNLFKALFCCLRAPDGPKLPPPPPPSQRALLEAQENGAPAKLCDAGLLPRVSARDQGKICVVIDLDETLVHSSFKPINNADFIVPVEIEGTTHQVYVLKRPYVDEFLQRMGELFECVLFTASLAKYADPVTDLLDQYSVFRTRLFRESCVFHQGCYVKDLSMLGRDLHKTLILDNSPASYIFHPNNAISSSHRTMNVFDRNIDLDALFKFSQISHSTQVHLKKVYSSLAACMFLAAAGAYTHVVLRLFQGGVVFALASLAMMVWLAATPHDARTEKKRLAILAGFAFLNGVGLGPTLDFVIAVNPSIIVTAFMGTSVIFICFTLSALYAKRRSYLFLGGTLMSGVSILFLMSLLNMLFGSVMLFKAHMYLGLLVMCGFVLFDTQLIIEKAENGDKDYVWHCVDLFLDFLTIFRKLMVILALGDKDKKKEKK